MTEKNETKTETKVEKAPKVTQNGVTRPKDGTKTAVVWEVADAISANQGKPARRKDVIEECMKREMSAATAATQYGRWRKFHGLKGSDEPAEQTQTPAAGETPAAKCEDIQVEGEPQQG